MTATDELRRMLDERGVEHFDGTESTLWGYESYNEVTGIYRFSADETSDGYMQVRLWHATPEQAIAATLGRGECHNASKVMDEHGQARFACSECGAWIDSRMLWNPEYRNGESPWVSGCRLNYCPNCGRRIVDPTTVLDEFVARWMETHHDDIPALKAEYAALLRLAEGVE